MWRAGQESGQGVVRRWGTGTCRPTERDGDRLPILADNVCRKVVKVVVEKGKKTHVKISPSSLEKYLGVPKYKRSESEGPLDIGSAVGLAWTELGGEILSIEVTVLPGTGKLVPTGQLGDVMKESAQAAMTYVRSRASDLGLPKNFYQKNDFYIHIPEGAVPKDGPSAGITMAVALVSALTKTALRHDVAMTGELTLTGKVLPIGGLKEKLLAALRGGIKKVLIPIDNEKDLAEIPDNVKEELEIVPVSDVDEVLGHALAETLTPLTAEQIAEFEARLAKVEAGPNPVVTH